MPLTASIRSRCLRAAVIGVCAFAALRADAAPTTAPAAAQAAAQAAVAKLVQAEPASRDAAQQALSEANLDAAALLAALQAARVDPSHASDLDLHARLDAVLVQAQERSDIGPTRITLHAHEAPLTEVLNEFTRQAHANFADPTGDFGGADQLPRVTLDLDGVPYWNAIQQLQSAAHISIMQQGGDAGWRILRANAGVPSLSGIVSGAFLIQPIQTNYSRSVSFMTNNPSAGENFSFNFNVLAEPKIHLDAAQGLLTLETAVDSNGNDLMGSMRSLPVNFAGAGANMMSCGFPLKYPKNNPGDHFAEISGTIRVLMARRTQMMSSEDFLAETSPLRVQTAEGVTLTLAPGHVNPNDADAQRQDEQLTPDSLLYIDVTIDGGDPIAVDRVVNAVNQQMRVTDGNGVRMVPRGTRQTRQATGRIDLQYRFVRGGNPERNRRDPDAAEPSADNAANQHPKFRLQLEVPTSIRQVEVPFALRDLKMP